MVSGGLHLPLCEMNNYKLLFVSLFILSDRNLSQNEFRFVFRWNYFV